jgi:FlaA1/EpsC-like NDP-sugar epimerase
VAIEVVGIRPGEKLREELFNVDETVRPTRYGKIQRATRPPLDSDALGARLDVLAARVAEGDPGAVAGALWAALRAGRDAAPGRESRGVAPTTEERS